MKAVTDSRARWTISNPTDARRASHPDPSRRAMTSGPARAMESAAPDEPGDPPLTRADAPSRSEVAETQDRAASALVSFRRAHKL